MAAQTVEGKIADALLARLGTLTLSPALPVAWPNVPFSPPAGTYLEAAFLPNRTENLFMSNTDPDMFQGLLQVTVIYKAANGIVRPNDIAGAIVTHFAKGSRIRSQGITIMIEDRPSVAGPIQDDTHIRLPVTVRYRCFA